MSKNDSVYIVAELCSQMGGNIRRAEQMILQAKLAGASACKIQLWDTYKLPGNNREHWEYLQINRSEFIHLKSYADSLNIDFFASAFDEERWKWIQSQSTCREYAEMFHTKNNRYNVPAKPIKVNKIASSVLLWNFELCKKMINAGTIHNKLLTYISLGRAQECIDKGYWNEGEFPFNNDNVKYLHCAFKYPQNTIEAINELPNEFNNNFIGYSDHTVGMEAAFTAIKRGAKVIEKHFTTDHNLQCTTESAHICSMNMIQLSELRNFCDKAS